MSSGLLCCFGCVSILGCRNKIVKKLTFFPPSPPGYDISGDGDIYLLDERGRYSISVSRVLLETQSPITCTNFSIHVENRVIQLLYFEHPSSRGQTVIFSHGNSTDIGYSWTSLFKFSTKLRVNLLAYDYSGYGLSTGESTEKNTYQDIRGVLKFAHESLGLKHHNIIVYGQSIGSGPSIDLVSDSSSPLIGGLVLHAGIASGLRFFKAFRKTPWYDIYRNVEKCRGGKVKCPVLMIHGTADMEVPPHHCHQVYQALTSLESDTKSTGNSNIFKNKKGRLSEEEWIDVDVWWVDGAGHNDIEIIRRSEYFAKLRNFFLRVDLSFKKFQKNERSKIFNLENCYSFSSQNSVKVEDEKKNTRSSNFFSRASSQVLGEVFEEDVSDRLSDLGLEKRISLPSGLRKDHWDSNLKKEGKDLGRDLGESLERTGTVRTTILEEEADSL